MNNNGLKYQIFYVRKLEEMRMKALLSPLEHNTGKHWKIKIY
jgi:hypothetical protein